MMKTDIAAIILAAGFSSRMGRLKPLLPLGKGSVIAHVAESFRAEGIQDILVVLGHRSRDIIPELEKNSLAWKVNQHYAQGMLSSIKKGIETLGDGTDAFFIIPVDIPLVRPATLRNLVNSYENYPGKIIYPSFQRQKGHPPLIPTRFIEDILQYEGPGGLQHCLEAWDRDSLEKAVADQGVLMDMDTPDDYTVILEKSKNLDIPSMQEAQALLAIHQSENASAMAHARAVASLAATIGKAMNFSGGDVNVPLIEAAGILHDIAKGRSDHARKGAELIAANGFQAAADVAGRHMDLAFDPSMGIGESEVVYLADKMVSQTEIVSLEKRLSGKKEQFRDDPEALKMMTFRMEQAIRIRQSIEKMIGKPLHDLNFS
ncbi:MAG: DVU_1551 family NTP transferase [Thermodesulfobacteriota bacterium]